MKIKGQGAEILRFLSRVHKGDPLLRKGSPKNSQGVKQDQKSTYQYYDHY